MIKVGITGGIGSGKSVVASIFEMHDVPVYNADKETKKLNNDSPHIREQLIHHFGKEVYDNNKQLDKKKFAEIIFSDNEKLELANSIIHPEVLKHFNYWCVQNSDHKIVALEAAILLEANFQVNIDKIVTVYSPLSQRISRVMARDGVSEAAVRTRMKYQISEREKIRMADYVIMNDHKSSLIDQVHNLIEDIMHRSI